MKIVPEVTISSKTKPLAVIKLFEFDRRGLLLPKQPLPIEVKQAVLYCIDYLAVGGL